MARTAIKFGVFVAVCLAFTLWLAFTIGNVNFEDRYELGASFDDVSGLLINDDVKIAGVVVGKVTNVKVDAGRAVVTFEVRNSVDLPTSTTAAVRWRNLIGQRYVYLYPGEPTPTKLEGGDVITETESVIDLGELFNRLGPIVAAIDPAQVNDFLDTVTAALEGNEDAISKTLDDLATLVDGLASRDDAIGRLIENTDTVAQTLVDREEQIKLMLDNLVVLADTFGANTEMLNQALIELGAFGEDLSFLLENNRAEIDRAIGNLDGVVDEVGENLDSVDRVLAGLPAAARAVYLSSQNGEFLNQAILCFTAVKPPCPHPLVPGLEANVSGEPVLFNSPTKPASGADALLAMWGLEP